MIGKHYVYTHTRPDTGQVFYVGMGQVRRPWNMSQRNKYHKNVQNKLDRLGLKTQVEILYGGISREYAWDLEKVIISIYGVKNLTNQSTGGEKSCLGWEPDEDFKNRASERMKETASSEEWRNRKSDEMKRKHSDPAYRKHMSKKLKGKKKPDGFGEGVTKRLSKPVVCLNDGLEWPSAVAAAKNYGIKGRNVSSICTGSIPHSRGYVFAYASEAGERLKDFSPPVMKWSPKAVICTTDGKKYKTMADAARYYGISTGNIRGVATGKVRHSKGHVFAYLDEGQV